MLKLDLATGPERAATTRVRCGRGAVSLFLEEAGDAPLVLLVVDEALAGLPLLAHARSLLQERGTRWHEASILAREDQKTVASAARLWDTWVAAGACRDAVVIALGGGLVSDVAGFAAACFHRGIPWLVMPTTTLALADAALGGKTGVNSAGGKNLVGAIHHPRAVIGDWDALASLPRAVFAEGLAEVIKAAAVGDLSLLEDVEAAASFLREGDADVAGPLLFRALAVKARVVQADAREDSRREILNFGHTLAHALEHATGHAVSHGVAVAAGMVAEALHAERIGRLEAGSAARIARACENAGLSWRLASVPSRSSLVDAMRRDKKVRRGQVRVALPDGLGRHGESPGVPVDPEHLADLLGQEPA